MPRRLLVAVVPLVFACSKPAPSTSGPPASTAAPVAAATASSKTPPGPKRAPLTAADLAPRLHESSTPGEMPDGLAIDFPLAVVDADAVGKPSAKTTLTLEPPLAGHVQVVTAWGFHFVPDRPFTPGATYTATLHSVETRDGVVAAPAAGWRHVFEVPAFKLARVEQGAVDALHGRVDVQLTFTGPVDADGFARLLRVRVDGVTPQVRVEAVAGTTHALVAHLTGPRFSERSRVDVMLAAGARLLGGDSTAPASSQSLNVHLADDVRVVAVHPREGPGGMYLEVFCDDTSVKQRRWVYSPQDGQGYDLSERCQLDGADAQAALHVTPKVAFTVSPSRGGFHVLGDFRRGTYSVRLDAGARSVDGGALHTTWEGEVRVPPRAAKVAFTSSGRYLPRSAWRSLPITHVNVEKVDVVVRQVPPENLVFWASEDRSEAATERNSTVVARATVAVSAPADAQGTAWLDVGALVPKTTKGLLEISLSGGGSTANARLLLTDLNLVAKRRQTIGAGGVSGGTREPGARSPTAPPARGGGEVSRSEEVIAWALDAGTTEPVSGVELSLVRKSGQAVARCTTDGEGGCVLASTPDLDPSAPFALLARRGDDFTYLKFDDLKAGVAEADVSGEPFTGTRPYRVALYADRGVYRPGDTAHAVAVLRGAEGAAPKAGMPVELRLVDPRGKIARKVTQPTNAAGVVTLDVPFAAFADTGRWRLVAFIAADEVGERTLQVEEFVPERMKVTAAADKPGTLLGEDVVVGVAAKYLFGGTPKGSKVELTCTLEPAAFAPKENAGFAYGVWREGDKPPKPLTLGAAAGELDAAGHAALTCPALAGSAAFPGAARVKLDAAVFEAGSGRTSRGDASALVHPERYYLGLLGPQGKVGPGTPVEVKGVVVDWDGKLAPDAAKTVDVELVRLESEYGMWYDDEEGGGESFRPTLRPATDSTAHVEIHGGRFQVNWTPTQDAAQYLVRVRAGNARTDLQLTGKGETYWWGGESRADETPRPSRAQWLTVKLPERLRVGESATAHFTAPWRGRALLTVETDHVVAHAWKKVEPGDNAWDFTLSAFAPNVYVTALVVKDPHLESKEAFMPDRAYGVGGATVEPTAYTQRVKLDAPAEVRSNSKLTVQLSLDAVDAGTFATVAAVDEGILQLTKFQSPDPLADVFARRSLGIDTFETIGWTLLLPPTGPTRAPGGDKSSGDAGRVQPVKPVALWSGLVPVGNDGKATVTFDVPQYRGALRVMAVTVGPRRIGHASAVVRVADPLTLQVTMPRFLSHGDDLQIPVFVTNLSGAEQAVTVSLAAEDLAVPGLDAPVAQSSPLELVGKSEKALPLKAGESGTVVFEARVVREVGAAKLRVVAKSGALESRDEADVPIQPSGPRSRQVQRVELAEGATDLKPLLGGWTPTTERSTFRVTTNPYGDAFDHLAYLMQYPYGCIEQTTSSTRPLLYLSGLVQGISPELAAPGKLEDMVQSGIARVFSMQTPSGGFAYWPGETTPDEWGTAYATHMLLDARKAGYAVPEERLEDALKWLEQSVTASESAGWGDHWYWYRDNEEYAHLVLALAGRPRKARALELLGKLPNERSGAVAERRYMLEAALYLAGDRSFEKELKSPDLSPMTDERHYSWDYYSDRRRRGFTLAVFSDLFGAAPEGEPLAELVAEALRAHPSGWYTTQEVMWGVTGLGKRLRGSAGNIGKARLVANGKTVEPRVLPGQGLSEEAWAVGRAGERQSLSLELADKPKGKVYLVVASEGIRADAGYKTGGEGLRLSRAWKDRGGNEIDPTNGTHALGDLVFVEVSLTNTTGERVSNLALVDRLPAGWEIENPRLGRGAGADWIDEDAAWKADYLDVRDDRLAIFGALEPRQTVKVVYAVRAVTAGTFVAPPVEAEAMYDPRVWAREGGRTIKVSGPWANYLD